MKVTKKLFNNDIHCESPVQKDYTRVVKYDEDGNEFVTYEEQDLASYQQSLGIVGDWSLDALLKAGIDPSFPIHTGYNTRLAGLDALNGISADVDTLFAETNNNETNA